MHAKLYFSNVQFSNGGEFFALVGMALVQDSM